eukprot:10889611-Heterocapsa_arctica.AAC.1
MENYTDAAGTPAVKFSVGMEDFLKSAGAAYSADVAKTPGSSHLRLGKAETPYTAEDNAGDSTEPAGLMGPVSASHLMRLLFAARVARPDLQTAIVRLSKYITVWKCRHDRALQRLMSYGVSSAALKLTGSLPIGQLEQAKLVVWPDADLAGDKGSSKATG